MNSTNNKLSFKRLMVLVVFGFSAFAARAQHQDTAYKGIVGKTLQDSKEWWPEPVRAPAGAPNVVWILLDDVGFGAASTFGGLISTPVFDSLAANGLTIHELSHSRYLRTYPGRIAHRT